MDWHVRVKDLRQFFGSFLLNAGKDPLLVARLMGHSSVDILLKRYGHFTIEAKKKTIRSFDRGAQNVCMKTGQVYKPL